MRGRWTSNCSGRFGRFSRSRLAAASASVPGYAGAMERAVEKIERSCQGSAHRWNNSSLQRYIGTKLTVLGGRNQDKVPFAGLAMKKRAKQQKYFAVCINNKRYEASLERGKLYRVIPDEEAEAHGYLRVIDESGEDYGYSADRFFRLEVP